MIDKIRNFSIIAHIDHGKTTLTDQLLRKTHTILASDLRTRLLDSNPIEQERGITIKLAPVRMDYQGYTLNLIDTPGHVDFAYEVSRSLSACEGALLVVDAVKGIQAQTIANFDKAMSQNLTIIPLINKIDLPNAETDKVRTDLISTLGFKEEEILTVSAKTGENIDLVLEAILKKIPAPTSSSSSDLRALVFSSIFHIHKGAIAFVKVISGEINTSNLASLYLCQGKTNIPALEIGFFKPDMRPTESLSEGEVGYIATGLKNIQSVEVGDTITTKNSNITPIPGYQKPQSMVYMDMYPVDADDFPLLTKGLEKLTLHDAALSYRPTASPALGHGFRVGFLGILHAEIVSERLSREFEIDVINTSPSVPYIVTLTNNQELTISSPSEFPDPSTIKNMEEPLVELTIYTRDDYIGPIMSLCEGKRALFLDMQYSGASVRLIYSMPLIELITNFYDNLKSASSGYASVKYEHSGYELVDAVKVDVLLNKEPAEALSFICAKSQAEDKARALVAKLKEAIPRQQFEIPIQAAIGGKIIARETIKSFRKDVTAKLYGGDITRRMKLLEKQKKGKKKMKQIGSVSIPQKAFTEILKI